MQIIHESKNDIMKFWNVSRVQDVSYRLFSYLIFLEVENGTLLHNVVTGELLFLDYMEMNQLAQLPCDYEPWMDELIFKHFIVKSEHNDKKTVDDLRFVIQLTNNKDIISKYVILPTTSCNARCFYCYEAGIKHENMSDETADKVVDFICSHHGNEPVRIRWYGGEPLVGIRQIDRISRSLVEKNVEFSSLMVSNGFLFDKETAKKAVEDWHLNYIQITLDGTEKVYNKTKSYINPCDNPYKKVIANIGFLLSFGIKVTIRLNMGLHNADDLNLLVDEIAEHFENRKNLFVHSRILSDDCGFSPMHFNSDEYNMLCKKNEILEDKIRGLSFSSPNDKLPHLSIKHCAADNVHSLVIVPSGKIGKCYECTENHFVGNIEEGITDTQEIQKFQEHVTVPECSVCALYPSCIKLRMCEHEKSCTPNLALLEIQKIKKIMKLKYDRYLNEKR